MQHDYDIMDIFPPEIWLNIFNSNKPQDIDKITAQAFAVTCMSASKIVRLYFRVSRSSRFSSTTLCHKIAERGYTDLLKYALSSIRVPFDLVSKAAASGNVECLEFAYKEEGVWSKAAGGNIGRSGSIPCLEFALSNKLPVDEVPLFAAKYGKLDILQYYIGKIDTSMSQKQLTALLEFAISSDFECSKYLIECGARINFQAMRLAAECGNLPLLKYLHSKGGVLTRHCCGSQEDHEGCLACHKYMCDNGVPWSDMATAYAAKSGHIKCMEYAREKGCKWHNTTCHMAVTYNRVNCLEYAHKNGAPINSSVIAECIGPRPSDCLKYCLENNFPRPKDVVRQRMAENETYRIAIDAGINVILTGMFQHLPIVKESKIKKL
jgi:hypothetical protein